MSHARVANRYAIIMAGGRGERFWPQSRIARPKQMLKLFAGKTLIEETVDRLLPIFPPSNIVIATNKDYVDEIRALLPQLPKDNVLGEPAKRDTAPCIALAAAYVKSIAACESPVLAILPSDAAIADADAFRKVISDSVELAQSNGECIVTVGIKPTSPNTGYGYIKVGDRLQTGLGSVFNASLGFKEKPSPELAAQYLASGDYRWNGGIFIMALSALSAELAKHAPDLASAMDAMHKGFVSGDSPLASGIYDSLKSISFDYAVMEKASRVVVADGVFGWDDVGSWTAVKNHVEPDERGNAVMSGVHVGVNSSNCIVAGEKGHLIATMNVKDLIVVATKDATLICDASSAQNIKEILRQLSSKPDLSNYL